jgi:hypothetical protein
MRNACRLPDAGRAPIVVEAALRNCDPLSPGLGNRVRIYRQNNFRARATRNLERATPLTAIEEAVAKFGELRNMAGGHLKEPFRVQVRI